MSTLSTIIVNTLVLGGIYSVAGEGIVITYRTSGIFNLAQGALAMVAGYLLYQLWIPFGIPRYLAAALMVFVVGPLVGIGLYYAVFRSLARVSVGLKIVATIALTVALEALAEAKYGTQDINLPPLFPFHALKIGSFAFGSDQLCIVFTCLVATLGLAAFFRFTTVGLAMRAVVDNRDLTSTIGFRVDQLAAMSWAIGVGFAFLAGVLLAPYLSLLSTTSLPQLVVEAFAAAACGALFSLPWTLVGGCAIALCQQLYTQFGPTGFNVWAALGPNISFIILVLVILLRSPWVRKRPAAFSELAVRFGKTLPRVPLPTLGVVIAALVALPFLLSGAWMFSLASAAVLAIALLSIVLLTGYSGQISLCQATLAGIGAYAAAYLVGRWHWPAGIGYLTAGVITVPIGLLIALPAIRVRGIYLALSTLAFAVVMENVIFPSSWFDLGNMTVPRPEGFVSDRAYYFLALAIFIVLARIVLNIRDGATGRALVALRQSPMGASSIGVNGARYRFIVFGASAFIVGIAGAMFGGLYQATSATTFSYSESLYWLAIVVLAGVGSVGGAFLGGFMVFVLPQIIGDSALSQELQQAAFGLAAVFIAGAPGGAMTNIRLLGSFIVRRLRIHAVPATEGGDEEAVSVAKGPAVGTVR